MNPPPDENRDYWARVEEILEAVLQTAPDDVEARLAELAGDDPDLAAEVRALLGHLPDPEFETSSPKPDDRFDTGHLLVIQECLRVIAL